MSHLQPILSSPSSLQSLALSAIEIPSFNIAPARLGHANDLITGNSIGTYNSATPAAAVGIDGLLFTPAANAPVVEYNPGTLASLGARIWGPVTNQIRNSTATGGVSGTPGTPPTNWVAANPSNGLNREIVGVGSIGQLAYADIRYYGTATATSATVIQAEPTTAIAAASGQTWTASAYVAIVGGSTSGLNQAGRIRVAGRTSGGSLNESTQIDFTPTSELIRRSTSITLANPNTARVVLDVVFAYSSGAAIDITLRIGLPQLEQSATMGPAVPTSGAAASSTADAWNVLSLTAGINNLCSFYVRGRTTASGTCGILSANDNTANNRLELSTSGTDPKAVAVTSGSTVADLNGGTVVANVPFRLAARFAGDSYALSMNGASVVTDASGARAIVDRLFLGRDQAGNYLNGYIEEMAGWTSALSDSTLQVLAAS